MRVRCTQLLPDPYEPRLGPSAGAADRPQRSTLDEVARVLVAEDDPTVSGVLVAYLAKVGRDPVACADGPAALAAWTRLRPQVVVLDVTLPQWSGLDGRPGREYSPVG